MQGLKTSDYRGYQWPSKEDEEDSYPLCVHFLSLYLGYGLLMVHVCYSPLVMKVRSRSGSVMSGTSTPGGGAFSSLSEGDLQRADAALEQVHDQEDSA